MPERILAVGSRDFYDAISVFTVLNRNLFTHEEMVIIAVSDGGDLESLIKDWVEVDRSVKLELYPSIDDACESGFNYVVSFVFHEDDTIDFGSLIADTDGMQITVSN